MSVRSLEMRERAGKLIHEARKINDLATGEKRALTAEERTRFDALSAEAEGLIEDAGRDERLETLSGQGGQGGQGGNRLQLGEEAGVLENGTVKPSNKYLQALARRRERAGQAEPGRASAAYHQAFMNFLANGELRQTVRQPQGALQIDLDTAGGFIATSERMLAGILAAVDDAVPFRGLATGFTAAPGETLGQVTLDTDLADDEWGAGELTEASDSADVAFGKREFKPRDIKRRVVKISKALIQAQTIDVEAFVQERRAVALGRTLEQAYMTGNGAEQPLGIFTASALGINTDRDVNTGNATGFTADGLITIQGTLKPQYEAAARWLFHRDAVTAIRKLKDGNGQYLWMPGLQQGTGNTILGKSYVTSEYVPNTYTNGLYAGMYGDFSYYWYVDRLAAAVQRLVELYARAGEIGLLFDGQGADGMPVMSEAFVRIKCAA
jgi:HK97 family phage major capsid protein